MDSLEKFLTDILGKFLLKKIPGKTSNRIPCEIYKRISKKYCEGIAEPSTRIPKREEINGNQWEKSKKEFLKESREKCLREESLNKSLNVSSEKPLKEMREILIQERVSDDLERNPKRILEESLLECRE